jgi:peptidoglycan/xylan/chitin deacetylase (PgdA/CDA1 family)
MKRQETQGMGAKLTRFVPVVVACVAAASLFAAAPSARAADAQQPVTRVATKQKVVALTFDDGPNPENAPKYLKLFKEEGVKATFFVVGNNVARQADLAKQMLAAGHEIGNHSMDHANLAQLKTEEDVRGNIARAQAAIKEAVGAEPKVFRAPFIAHDEKTWRVLGALKLPSVGARLDTRDWDGRSTVDSITDAATISATAGDIVLMHEWSAKTLEAMPEIIKRLKAKGFAFVTVSELLEIDKPKPPAARGK